MAEFCEELVSGSDRVVALVIGVPPAVPTSPDALGEIEDALAVDAGCTTGDARAGGAPEATGGCTGVPVPVDVTSFSFVGFDFDSLVGGRPTKRNKPIFICTVGYIKRTVSIKYL